MPNEYRDNGDLIRREEELADIDNPKKKSTDLPDNDANKDHEHWDKAHGSGG